MTTKHILDQLPALDRTVYPSKNAGTFNIYDELRKPLKVATHST